MYIGDLTIMTEYRHIHRNVHIYTRGRVQMAGPRCLTDGVSELGT